MSITFSVDPVEIAAAPQEAEALTAEHVHKLLGEWRLRRVVVAEGVSAWRGEVLPDAAPLAAWRVAEGAYVSCPAHPFLMAATAAYCEHRPLTFSPDHVWALLLGGLATHLMLDPEAHRAQLVGHHGVQTITARRDDLHPDQPDLPWHEVVEALAAQTAAHLSPLASALHQTRFSTTDPIARTVHQLGLLDTVQSYFRYELLTLCGIPTITLEGDPEDWEAIHAILPTLDALGMSWWTRALAPLLDALVATSYGEVDVDLWRAFLKEHHGSGGPYYTGWITWLFPYTRHITWDDEGRERPVLARSPLLEDDRLHAQGWRPDHPLRALIRTVNALDPHDPFPGGDDLPQLTSTDIPLPLRRVPLTWRLPHTHTTLELELLTGFLGVRQLPDTLTLRPELGWAIRRPQPPP